MSCWKTFIHIYRKTSKQEQKQNIKQQNTLTKNKEMQMLSPLWTHQNIKVQKSLALVTEEFTTTFHSPVKNAHIRLLLLYLI